MVSNVDGFFVEILQWVVHFKSFFLVYVEKWRKRRDKENNRLEKFKLLSSSLDTVTWSGRHFPPFQGALIVSDCYAV